ncbi:hypothetical protein NPIL_170931 [Nephila pilipes]|uniref:Uncharacterized protein n=1 Tax=Nephila pilipes TaxID=299642 RepID=A0A8X6P8Z5_NEPPI|nr:hypothetical protein NPIL_170931 [Nephila pilipes]
MDLYSSPASSPISSQEPMIQDYNSACLLRRKYEAEQKVMTACLSNRVTMIMASKNDPFFNEDNELYQREIQCYRETEEQLQLLVSTANSIPSCEITGCPHHYPQLDNENHSKKKSFFSRFTY